MLADPLDRLDRLSALAASKAEEAAHEALYRRLRHGCSEEEFLGAEQRRFERSAASVAGEGVPDAPRAVEPCPRCGHA